MRQLEDLALDPLEGSAIGGPGCGGVGRAGGAAQRRDCGGTGLLELEHHVDHAPLDCPEAVEASVGRIELLRQLEDLALDPLERSAIDAPGCGGIERIGRATQRLDLLGDMAQLLLEPGKVLGAGDFRVELALTRGDFRKGVAQSGGPLARLRAILIRQARRAVGRGGVECDIAGCRRHRSRPVEPGIEIPGHVGKPLGRGLALRNELANDRGEPSLDGVQRRCDLRGRAARRAARAPRLGFVAALHQPLDAKRKLRRAP